MKNKIFFLFLQLISINCFAQWEQLNSGTENFLLSVYFINEDTGIVVGQYGTILKTVNGGENWIYKISGTTQHLSQVIFLNDSVGFAVGTLGTILKTIDAGETWNSKSFNTFNSMNSISFSSSLNGIIVGSNATILKTENQGESWNQLQPIEVFSDTVYELNSIRFVNDSVGYAAGGNFFINPNSVILKTTDSGNGWNIIFENELNNPETICSIFPISESRYWALAFKLPQTYGPWLVYSNDGGNNSTLIGCPPFCYIPNSWVDGIFFTDLNTGYMAAGGSILSTIDGGISWQELNLGFFEQLDAVFFASKDVGYAVGINGKIVKTINAGGLTSSINEVQNLSFDLFPNPNQGEFLIRLSVIQFPSSKYQFTIQNLFGETMPAKFKVTDKNLVECRVNCNYNGWAILIIKDQTSATSKIVFRSKFLISK